MMFMMRLKRFMRILMNSCDTELVWDSIGRWSVIVFGKKLLCDSVLRQELSRECLDCNTLNVRADE